MRDVGQRLSHRTALLSNPTNFMDSMQKKPVKATAAFRALPEVWQLIRPRRGLLATGFVLMVINRVSGLVLPASTKFLVDNIIGKRQLRMLPLLVGIVLTATLVQGMTSFTLTQT